MKRLLLTLEFWLIVVVSVAGVVIGVAKALRG